MNLRDLEYLVALADHRHFGRAAAACFVSQPTLSTQVKKLEAELGAPLIERAPRSVLLTSVGEQVVERARSMLAQARDIRAIAERASDPRSGTVRIGLFPTLGPYLLPHVVERLRDEFPHLEVLLVEQRSEELLTGLRAGDLDAALLALPVAAEALHVEPLFREEFLLAVPVDHPLAARTSPVTSDVLAGEELLLLAEGHCLRDQALDVCARTGLREREGFQATSLETLRHMVATGVGITLLPRLSVAPPVAEHPGIRLLEIAGEAPHRDVAMVWRRSGLDAVLLTEIADLFRDLPAGLVRPLPAGSGQRRPTRLAPLAPVAAAGAPVTVEG